MGVSLEVSTLARIIESNTRRVRYDAGGHAEEDSIIQGCEPRAVFKIMSEIFSACPSSLN